MSIRSFYIVSFGSIRISEKDNIMVYLGNCLQEGFIDGTAALVERAGAAMGPSSTRLAVFSGKSCAKVFSNSLMPYAFSGQRPPAKPEACNM